MRLRACRPAVLRRLVPKPRGFSRRHSRERPTDTCEPWPFRAPYSHVLASVPQRRPNTGWTCFFEPVLYFLQLDMPSAVGPSTAWTCFVQAVLPTTGVPGDLEIFQSYT